MTNLASQALAGPALVPAALGMMTQTLRVLVPAGLVRALVLAALGILAQAPAALGTKRQQLNRGHNVAFFWLKYD